MASEGSVLGIDVGWSPKKKTSAVCRLSWSDREIEWKIGRFLATDYDRERAISSVASDSSLLAVAIDGPLRPGFNEIGHYRSAERLLSRGELRKRIGKPGQSSSPNGKKLNIQANYSAKFVKQHCHIPGANHHLKIDRYAIVEAFPTTFLGVMIENPALLARPKKRSDRYFIHVAKNQYLEKLVQKLIGNRIWSQPLSEVVNHDDRAALVCAFTAVCVATGEFTAVGDKKDGWIILPPRWMFAGWAWTAVLETASLDESGKLLSFPDVLSRSMT